jgi:hypothetical protein
VAKKALVMTVTAPAFAAEAPADNPLFQQPLVSNVNVPSQNVVPAGNGNGNSNGGAGNTVGDGNSGGIGNH